jgi:cephalosporin hydroxylase
VPSGLPPTVQADAADSVESYVRSRLRQHTSDSYAGIPMSKFPEDLRVYEHLLWASRADVVLELGVQFGGSSLWFRDRLHALGRYRPPSSKQVIAVDVVITAARERLAAIDPSYADDITLIEGSVADPELVERVGRLIPPGARCLVIEDTAHVYETTLASLRGFSRFVHVGGFFVVEDGCVDIESLRISDDWPRGVVPAIGTWLEHEGHGFVVRSDLELYGVTCHPGGFLQRTA